MRWPSCRHRTALALPMAVCFAIWAAPIGRTKEPTNLWTRTQGEDWPQFLGPRRDGTSAERGIHTRWDEHKPRIVWQRELGEGYGIGSVARGRFFQLDRVGNDVRLVCLYAESGKLIWEYRYPTTYQDYYGYDGGPRCSPVIDNDRVYIYGPEGMLTCLSVIDGQVRWQVDTARQFGVVQNFFGVGSTPIIFEDKLWVMVGGSPREDQGFGPGQLDRVRGNGTAMVAFDKLSGRVLHKVSDELASYASPRVDIINDRPWCFAYCRGGLLAFDPRNGKIDFHYPWRSKLLESVIVSSPVVVGNEVLITETYGPGSSLLRVKPGGYEVIWKDEPRSRNKKLMGHMMTPIYDNGYVYACSGRNPPVDVRCLEWKTGKLQWKVDNQYRTSFLRVDGHLVSMDEAGSLKLVKLDPKAYQVVAEWDLAAPNALGPGKRLKYPCWAAPILAHGLLYVRGAGRLVCLELIEQPARP